MSALRSSRMLARTLYSTPAAASRMAMVPSLSSRAFSATRFSADEAKPAKPEKDMTPYPVENAPQFPAPTDPFHPEPAKESKKEYSETQKALVRGAAKMLGYNSKQSTAIRESGRMMRGVVDAVEADRSFWYDTCGLPPTYQSFFQIHLLYVLLLVTRLRALRSSRPDASPIPESIEPGTPHDAPSQTHPKGTPILGKAAHEAYPTELLSHFFELAESQMRMVLGRGERESVIRKYMEEMGEQWKGAGTGLDYVLGLGISSDPADVARADAEMASWVWRNLFSSRGLSPTPVPQAIDELAFVEQLEAVVRWVRQELYRLDSVSDEDVLDGNIGNWDSLSEDADKSS